MSVQAQDDYEFMMKIIKEIKESGLPYQKQMELLEKSAMEAQNADNSVMMSVFRGEKYKILLENTGICGVGWGSEYNCKWWNYEDEYCVLLEIERKAYTPRCKHSNFRFKLEKGELID